MRSIARHVRARIVRRHRQYQSPNIVYRSLMCCAPPRVSLFRIAALVDPVAAIEPVFLAAEGHELPDSPRPVRETASGKTRFPPARDKSGPPARLPASIPSGSSRCIARRLEAALHDRRPRSVVKKLRYCSTEALTVSGRSWRHRISSVSAARASRGSPGGGLNRRSRRSGAGIPDLRFLLFGVLRLIRLVRVRGVVDWSNRWDSRGSDPPENRSSRSD